MSLNVSNDISRGCKEAAEAALGIGSCNFFVETAIDNGFKVVVLLGSRGTDEGTYIKEATLTGSEFPMMERDSRALLLID